MVLLHDILTSARPSCCRRFTAAPAPLSTLLTPADVGFDPLGFTNVFDVKWMREAELKHCRITMLACLGFLVQEIFTLPAAYFPNNIISVDAHDYFVKTGGMQQLLLWFCFAEFFSLLAVNYTMNGGDRAPGDFGFDPLNLASTPAKRAQMELSEIKNGRLAMIGIGGLIHQVRRSALLRVVRSWGLLGSWCGACLSLCPSLTRIVLFH